MARVIYDLLSGKNKQSPKQDLEILFDRRNVIEVWLARLDTHNWLTREKRTSSSLDETIMAQALPASRRKNLKLED